MSIHRAGNIFMQAASSIERPGIHFTRLDIPSVIHYCFVPHAGQGSFGCLFFAVMKVEPISAQLPNQRNHHD
jgi:hypothetical protein